MSRTRDRRVALLCAASLVAMLTFLAVPVCGQSLEFGRCLHGISQWRSLLLIVDWETGSLYALDPQARTYEELPVRLRVRTADIAIQGDTLLAVAEGERTIERYDLARNLRLSPVRVPASAHLEDYTMMGIEWVDASVIVLGARCPGNVGRCARRLVVFDLVTGQQELVADSTYGSELIELRVRDGALWTFDWTHNAIRRIQITGNSFSTRESVDVAKLLPDGAEAPGGFRGFYITSTSLVITSIWGGRASEHSTVHIVPLPDALKNPEPSGLPL